MTDTPRIYVGTYNAYNNGDLYGDWFELDDYADKDEFLEATREYHSREEDPELMFQDWENIPSSFISESHIKPEFWDYMEAIEDMDDSRLEAFTDWMANESRDVSDMDALVEEFNQSYQGEFTEENFADECAEQNGWFATMRNADINLSYFDTEAYARDLFMDGYWRSDNGHVFAD